MRRFLLSAIKILVSAALLYLALRKVNFADLIARLDLTSAAWLALAVAITFLQIFIGVLRWRIVGAECGAPAIPTPSGPDGATPLPSPSCRDRAARNF